MQREKASLQLTIQTNTPANLVALQGPQPAVDSVWMYILLAGVFFGLTFYQRQWKLAVVPLGILLLGVLSYVGRLSKPSYRMAANFSTGVVHSEKVARDGNVVSSSRTLPCPRWPRRRCSTTATPHASL